MDIEAKGLKDVMKSIDRIQNQSTKVVQRTASDLKSRAPGWVNTSVSDVYNIKKKSVKDDYKGTVKINHKGIVDFALKYKGRLRTLYGFGLKPSSPPTKRQKLRNRAKTSKYGYKMIRPVVPYQISVEILKGQRKTFASDEKSYIFLSRSNNSPFLAWKRDRDSRKAQVLKTISVPQMIANPEVQEKITHEINTEGQKRFEHHAQQAMKNL